ncbi:MAG: DAK2 domain-containing protein [Oscillospiraceae bacterium]|nr:DAK2 domain-containing protein [Oscillospiraceae bacterium]
MTEFITGAAFTRMIQNAAAAIENHKTEINELNVFPVPDGDTGTNMSLTMSKGAEKLAESASDTIGKAVQVTAAALLRGARGNSGVILSLLYRGVSNELRELDVADAVTFSRALQAGSDAAYANVRKPTEGTILTVARLAAEAATARAAETRDIEDVLEYALSASKIALADTINLNPVLKKAGVIDSGGKGYVYILDAMLRSLRGETIASNGGDTEPRDSADFTSFSTDEITFAYCTEFIVARETKKHPDTLREFLDARGDSIVVVDDDEIIKVHVHTNDPGVVLTEALTFGGLLTVKIENMREQHTQKLVEAEAQDVKPVEIEKRYGMVAVSSGEGLSALFRDLGADGIITGGQTMNPSTEDILNAVERVPAEIVFVYPNNSNIIFAAQQVVPLSTRTVIVVPSKSIPQGISAMLVFDADEEPDTLETAMTDALATVRTIQITHAARDSTFDGLDIKTGQFLGLLDDSMYFCGDEFDELLQNTVTTALASVESPNFVTIFAGEGASDEESAELAQAFESRLPSAEITSAVGGQPVYRYIISVE